MSFAEKSKLVWFVDAGCCNVCSVPIMLPQTQYDKCKADVRESFHCSNGHALVFKRSDKDIEIDRLKRDLQTQKETSDWFKRKLTQETSRSRAFKGEVTKIKNRVKHGVCPCCKRSFQNLKLHMKSKHPKFGGANDGN